MKWQTINKSKNQKFKIKDVIKILLENRGIKTRQQIEEFLDPKLKKNISQLVSIDKNNLKKAVNRIKLAIKNKEQIVVFGDYDVDGICATTILWETLNNHGAKVLPYIPHRVDEGYGLSVTGISNIKNKIPKVELIITVDNGIIANEAVEFANKEGIDVIITDHHVPSEKLPKAFSIIHSTKVCGAGVSWVLCSELNKKTNDDQLVLVALATIADLMPLVGINRAIVKQGIKEIKNTKNTGLLEIIKEAGLAKENIGVYEISYIISPRINASGRIEKAMDSLRLLCTKDKNAARLLAEKLGRTNKKRQKITEESLLNAKAKLATQDKKKLIFIYDEIYEQGVIGLVAGKLVEEYYLPAIVLSKGEKYTKASARSISGFNIIEFIRQASDFLIDAGGHPMAAGFTVKTEDLEKIKEKLEGLAEKLLDKERLTKILKIDCELPFSLLNNELFNEIKRLEPFGMGNPQPVFVSKGLIIKDLRWVGNGNKHLKFRFKGYSPVDSESSFQINGIWFNPGNDLKLVVGDKVDVAYILSENVWNGNSSIELKIKSVKIT